ncbi:hypothetical protein KL929_000213 [Ogataea haglerorum]|nr:hypothetical protein KL951_002306 [Ogataea haglerorum]KAG7771427.1 hypothetical protein KL931_001125 [Ogataea haglerorum]KAG7800674.1 hypothetical protein KL929_000213 [Ogataea haglerorum]KAG7804467.1 hypothetical protein KL944_000213 [Ogataea haglerorum]
MPSQSLPSHFASSAIVMGSSRGGAKSTGKMSFLQSPPSLAKLQTASSQKLAQVSDFPLDYNIFLFKEIKHARERDVQEMIDFRLDLFDSIPQDYSSLIFRGLEKRPDGSYELFPTTTSKLHDRLLELLILERHRRDISQLSKITGRTIEAVELADPNLYEIKSPIYQQLLATKDEYQTSFKRFAMLQNVEYDFENRLDGTDVSSDDDLVQQFCTQDVIDVDPENLDELRLAQILIPLASKAIFE